MPKHVHTLISFIDTIQPINTIIGNGKRFMAYEIINRLTTNNETRLLEQLTNNEVTARKQNNKQHEVWELSFHWKECWSNGVIYQKSDYMHTIQWSGNGHCALPS